ncbi:hypothetical protein VNO80_13003 [Phaseolus coccineus]|uniref:Uncharacterized protein n=1 Tax=Phaseolus coccineus TaxID=3886 RepID=A0AAN9N0D7_PHACN
MPISGTGTGTGTMEPKVCLVVNVTAKPSILYPLGDQFTESLSCLKQICGQHEDSLGFQPSSLEAICQSRK